MPSAPRLRPFTNASISTFAAIAKELIIDANFGTNNAGMDLLVCLPR